MLVMGIDPGTRKTGWGFVSVEEGLLRHVDSGVIRPPTTAPLEVRLLAIFEGLSSVIEQHRPDSVAIEDIFFAKHPQGALKLGHARGVALLAAAKAGIEIHSYPPAQVKRALSGFGRADKGQVSRLVTMLLRLTEAPLEDQADALAVGICHAAAANRLRGVG